MSLCVSTWPTSFRTKQVSDFSLDLDFIPILI